jgi:uncharacterized protein YjbJ (UPF0337 family)
MTTETSAWTELRGRLRERWPALSEEELDAASGSRDELVALVEMQLGYAHRVAAAEVDTIVSEVPSSLPVGPREESGEAGGGRRGLFGLFRRS